MNRLCLWFKNLGLNLVVGCQVVAYMLAVPWITTAVLIWLFPGFSYGLVERWVCPAGSSIQVQGTKDLLDLVLLDDESVEYPKYTCVYSQGAVVLSGDSYFDKWLVYMRIAGVVLRFYLSLIIVFVLISKITRGNLNSITLNEKIPPQKKPVARIADIYGQE